MNSSCCENEACRNPEGGGMDGDANRVGDEVVYPRACDGGSIFAGILITVL